jgi:AAA15 family ATPase/GTPase
VTPQGRIAMPLVAEGLRKFATLHTIWKNGWLRPGTCLFWDEPEANLNPKLMDEAVAAILALAQGGVQVFLATHSYVILKELEVQATPDDSVRFFALEPTPDGTKVHPADRYLDLKPNPIEDQYASLFDRTVERRLREQTERV